MSKKAKLFLEKVMAGHDDSSVNLEHRIRAAEILLRNDTDVKKDPYAVGYSYLQRVLTGLQKDEDSDECSRSSVIEANGKSFHIGAIIQVSSGSWKYPKCIGEIIQSLDLKYRNSHHLVKLHNENVEYFVFPTYLLKTWTPKSRL